MNFEVARNTSTTFPLFYGVSLDVISLLSCQQQKSHYDLLDTDLLNTDNADLLIRLEDHLTDALYDIRYPLQG